VFLLVYSGAKVSILCTNHKFFPEKAIGITIIGGEKSLLGQRLWGKGYRLKVISESRDGLWVKAPSLLGRDGERLFLISLRDGERL